MKLQLAVRPWCKNVQYAWTAHLAQLCNTARYMNDTYVMVGS